MDFVRLVWADADARRLNPAPAEWMPKNDADGNEPWVFVVGADGVIRLRLDNVANEDQIEAAVQQVSR